MPAVKHSEWQM